MHQRINLHNKKIDKSQFHDQKLHSKTEASVLLWCFRILDYCNITNGLYRLVNKNHMRMHGGGFEELLAACAPLNLPDAVDDVMDLVRLLPALIREVGEVDLPRSAIERSIDTLSDRCEMTDAEKRLLFFGITMHENELLEGVLEHCFRKIHSGQLFKVLAHILDVGLIEIQAAFSSDSFLSRSGLLQLNPRPSLGFESNIYIGAGILETFEIANGNWDVLVSKTCIPAFKSSLNRDDFDHMPGIFELVLNYLEGSVCKRRRGVNILLHGIPGCGKTEFARAVAAASSLNAHELVSQRLDGHPLSFGERRCRYRQASEYLNSDQPCVLIVDEMDGMLEIAPPGRNGQQAMTKASANALLESNPVPTIWLTNNRGQFDQAQLRRFDLVVTFKRPSSQKIKKILENKLEGHELSDQWFSQVSQSEKLSPGLVNTLSLVAASVKKGSSQNPDMESMLNMAMQQRGVKIKRYKPSSYRIEYCNASMPVNTLTSTLTKNKYARCLLSGSTGTGKTSFARYMAEELSLEPRLVRPSDILDPFVGVPSRTSHICSNPPHLMSR